MFPRITEYIHQLMDQRIEKGEHVIDATMGNGHDTLYLAKLVGEKGRVHAFDIQEQAVKATQKRLMENDVLPRVDLNYCSHAKMSFPKDSIGFIVFNLGYLPGSDQIVTTKEDTTIQAIEKSLSFLKVGGLIVLAVYWGHEAGKREREKVEEYVEQLPYPRYMVLKYQYVNPTNCPPFILAIERRN